MKLKSIILSAAASMALYSGSANAATIAVVKTGFAQAGDGNASFTNTATLNYTLSSGGGGNVLVLGAFIDKNDSAGAAATITFGGSPAVGRISSDRGTMAYFETDPLATTITVNVQSATTGFLGFVLWELSNVDLSLGVVSGIGSSITTTNANTFVLGTGFANGNPTLTASGSAYTTTNIAPFLIQNNTGAGVIGGASGLAATPGNYGISWANQSNGSALAFGFTAIPEPGAAMLGSLGLLALLRRRR